MVSTARSRTTVADLIAAASLGAIDPSTPVIVTNDDDPSFDLPITGAPQVTYGAAVPLSATEHDCGIAGCKHGDAHPAVSQPDRQVKLACPFCGAVARMTQAALTRAVGITCQADGGSFVPVARRIYIRKGA